jgi:dihydroorotase-like cyclic amidohydrolase
MLTRLPGLIDIHVHLREPGATYKEDWDSGSAAALAGGFTQVLAMPNTQPPITNAASFEIALDAARSKARCDYAQFVGAGADNFPDLYKLAPRSAGLKMYLDQTYGPLRLDDMTLWMAHMERWPRDMPLVAHAEGRTLAAVLLVASIYDRSIHLAHISRREEILLVRKARQAGVKVTCDVTPHHLFLSEQNIASLGQGRAQVRPILANPQDRDSLWENLEVIDCFATDHAPHTLVEKDSANPPPGFPGLETALPLLLTAVNGGRLSIESLVTRMYTNPRRIFNLPEQPETWIEVDLGASWEIHASEMYTRCAWTPFEGRQVKGRLKRVVLRGQDAYRDGQVLASPGSGKNMRRD